MVSQLEILFQRQTLFTTRWKFSVGNVNNHVNKKQYIIVKIFPQHLVNFRFPEDSMVTCFALQQLCRFAPNLRVLNLSRTHLDYGCLESLSSLGLVNLDLSDTLTSDYTFKKMIAKPFFIKRTLRSLKISRTCLSLYSYLNVLVYFSNIEELIGDYSAEDILSICKFQNKYLFYTNNLKKPPPHF